MSNIIRIYNNILDPNLWNENNELDSKVRKDLLQLAKDFYKSTEFKSKILDILFLGSCVNYNWTPESDIDLHVVIDISKEGLDKEHYRKYLDSLGARWNCQHDIKIKGHELEVYIQDIKDKNSTIPLARKHSGMFSLLSNKWLIFPKKEKIQIDRELIKAKFLEFKGKIDKFIKDKDLSDLKELMKSLREYRNKGLEDEGEFSIENLVFKALRHTGVLEQLRDSINNIYDQQMSIKEFFGDVDEVLNKVIQETINERTKESEDLLPECYSLSGAIDDDLNISCLKNHKSINHLVEDVDPLSAIEWKYRSDKNELYWTDFPSQIQLKKTKDFLKEHHKISKPIIINVYDNPIVYEVKFGYEQNHLISEYFVDKLAKLYLGFIRRIDFKVVGIGIEDEEYTHNNFAFELGQEWLQLGDSEYIPWRYKKKENIVYWWSARPWPNEDEKESVEKWLEQHIGIKSPTHRFIGHTTGLMRANISAHSID
jgi:predicted nucleotidyltransferase